MEKNKVIILILVFVIVVLIMFNYILPRYEEGIYLKAANDLAFTQAEEGILFYPAIQTLDNSTIIQSITWQELCQGLGG